MIESFFRSLEREGVAYLLISGQAAVLYGAASFSEDVDIWIKPTASNGAAFLTALRSVRASYYKLTPPLSPHLLQRGHGFHFCVPDAPEFYLDAMGQPPRVPDFDAAKAEAITMDTSWGPLPTVGIKHLAALKMTQRLGDYPIVGQLVLRYVGEGRALSKDDLAWAVAHVFTVDDLSELLLACPDAARACAGSPALSHFAAEIRAGGSASGAAQDDAEACLAARVLDARRADRDYWKPIIAELKDLRNRNELMPVGRLV
jgi:hypothetical protein